MRYKSNTQKSFSIDMLLNIFASSISVAVLNLLIYPLMAENTTTEVYGSIATCVGLINLVNGAFGSSITYTKLLHIKNSDARMNYNVVFIICCFLGVVTNIFLFWVTGCMVGADHTLLLALCSIMCITNNYLIVEYRINLSYAKVLINSVVGAVGYFIGYALFLVTESIYWELIFLISYLSMTIFNLVTTNGWRSGFCINKDLPEITKSTGILLLTSSISGTSTYLDKLLVYPMLGAASMAIYQTATVVSKTVPLLASAIGNVLLSYLVNMARIRRRAFVKFCCLLAGIAIVGYFVCELIVPLIVKLLYASYYERCINYIPYANAIAMLNLVYSFLYPFPLRYTRRKNQLWIQGSRLVVYLGLCLWLLPLYGLRGFCWATIISLGFQICLMFVLTCVFVGGKEERNG